MRPDLDEIQALYDRVAWAEIHVHEFDDPLIRDFSFAFRNFSKQLGEDAAPTSWGGAVQSVSRYRYTLAFTLLPANDPEIFPSQALEQFERIRVMLGRSHPRLVVAFDAVWDRLRLLEAHSATPITDTMRTLITAGESMVVVASDHRQVALARRALESSWPDSPPRLHHQTELRDLGPLDRVIVPGPAAWFRNHVTASPRARRIDVIRPYWIRDEINTGGVFSPGSDATRKITIHRQQPTPVQVTATDHFQQLPVSSVAQASGSMELENLLDALEVNPPLNVNLIAQRHRGTFDMAGERHEMVSARLLLLEGERGVFLEDDTRVYCVNFSASGDDRIRRVKIGEIDENTLIALRTSRSEHDLIEQLADRSLGSDAMKLREMQGRWKRGLENKDFYQGIEKLCEKLRFYGAKYARPVNVRRWMSSESIWTERAEDFEAILLLLDLFAEKDAYVSAMRRLEQAHLIAGQQVRRLLLEQLRTIDLGHLQQEGALEISLPGVDGGKLTVFRVLGIPEATARIPANQLGQPFPLDG